MRPCPTSKTMCYIHQENDKYERAQSTKEKKKLTQESGCKGSYVLQQLPFHDRTQDAPIDPMHLLKNVIEHMVKLITGFEDSVKNKMMFILPINALIRSESQLALTGTHNHFFPSLLQ